MLLKSFLWIKVVTGISEILAIINLRLMTYILILKFLFPGEQEVQYTTDILSMESPEAESVAFSKVIFQK